MHRVTPDVLRLSTRLAEEIVLESVLVAVLEFSRPLESHFMDATDDALALIKQILLAFPLPKYVDVVVVSESDATFTANPGNDTRRLDKAQTTEDWLGQGNRRGSARLLGRIVGRSAGRVVIAGGAHAVPELLDEGAVLVDGAAPFEDEHVADVEVVDPDVGHDDNLLFLGLVVVVTLLGTCVVLFGGATSVHLRGWRY